MATIVLLSLVLAPSIHAMGSISIREGPRNVTLLRGGTVELRCVFMNIGMTQVMWFRSGGEMISNGNNILPNARPGQGSYHLAGDKKRGEYFLVIPNVQLGDADEYSCAYTKENGDMDSRSAFLIVQAPPSAGYPMCSVEQASPRVGDYVTFICISEGGVPNANLAWYRNDVAKTPITLQMSSFRKVLKLDDMTAQFVCKADSPVEDSPRRCNVQPVQIAPSVIMNPSELTGVLGDELYVSCIRVDKPSQTNFMWFYNNDAIENLADSRRFQILGNGDTLKIARLARRDNDVTIKCQLQIYKGFMKHESGAISVQVSDLNDPVLSTTSTFSSEVVRKEDVTTSYTSGNTNASYSLVTTANENNNEGEAQKTNTALTMILMLIAICFVVILVLVLLFFKSVRNRKVAENNGNSPEREGQRANGNLRHVYETSFPVTLAENEVMLAQRDPQFDRATYQDHDADIANNQVVPHHGDTSRHTELMRYQSGLVAAPKNPKDKQIPTNHASDGVYEIPYTDGRTSPSLPSPSSDGYVDIMKEKGQYDEFNHRPQVPIHHRLDKKGFQITPDNKPRSKPILRPVKSEASIVDSLKSGRPITKHTSALNLLGEDVAKPSQKIDSPKNKRIKPNSPPPTQIVPRPNNIVLKQSPNFDYSHEIQKEIPSPSDVLSNKSSNKLVRPMVALKPAIKIPPNQIAVQKSPRPPQKNINRSDGLTDKDGYEIPVDKSKQLTKNKQKGSNNSYEYEQIDHVMTSPNNDKCVRKNNNKIPPSEYTLLDKRTVERSNYQDLTSPSESSSSSGSSMTSRRSSQHEYETPLFNEPKKQTVDKPVYLEILD